MTNISWEQFGLKKNPYDISPLVEGGDVNVSNAFVGRNHEREFIDDILASEERACITICGNVGVGKTSMANYQKYLWKYHVKKKQLFSFRREIEANEELLNKKSFILEVIGSIMNEIELLDPQLIEKSDFLQKMTKLIDITQTFGISGNVSTGIPGIINVGADFSDKQLLAPIQLTTVALEKSFSQLLQYVMTNKIRGVAYEGLIIHVNNFDVVMESNKKQTKQFFAEIRDFLQTKNVFFIFLGPSNFYKEIIGVQDRVKSIFMPHPLLLEPLTKKELVDAFNKRLALLKSENVEEVIKPFEDEVIFELYDLFSGDVRLVMKALRDVLIRFADKLPQTLSSDETLIILGGERISRIEKLLTEEQMKVLGIIVGSKKPITQSEIAVLLKKAPTNMSSYYFRKLAELGVIEVKKEEGKHKYWHLTKEFLPLQRLSQAQKNLQEKFGQANRQLELFGK